VAEHGGDEDGGDEDGAAEELSRVSDMLLV